MTNTHITRPYGIGLFCDDVREEVGGKMTFVGVYGSTLHIEEIGDNTFLPTFCFVAYLQIEHGMTFKNLKMELLLPGDEDDAPSISQPVDVEVAKRGSSKLDDAKSGKNTKARLSFIMKFAPFQVVEFGRIRARAIWDDEAIPLGTLQIAPPPRTS